jgi:uncharacterized membrane protein
MKILKKEWLQILILAVPFCAVVLLWDKLPAQMPTQWDGNSHPGNYRPKALAALMLPCGNLVLAALLMVLPRIDPRFAGYDEETKASLWRTFSAMRRTITLFLSILGVAGLLAALHPAFPIGPIVIVGVAVLFMIFGNLLTKLRPNWFFGIRTPWTLESRDVWVKTHRLGGKLMIIGGFCLLMLLAPPVRPYCVWVGLAVVAFMAIVPIVYSYIVCARLRRIRGRTGFD